MSASDIILLFATALDIALACLIIWLISHPRP